MTLFFKPHPMMIKRLTLSLILFCIGTSAQAQASTWTGELTVARAFTEGSDLIVFYTVGAHPQTPNCSVGTWIYKVGPDARRNRVYATLLTAIVTGKKIALWQRGDGCAEWGYHEATAVMIIQ